jgi:hypothetical protein
MQFYGCFIAGEEVKNKSEDNNEYGRQRALPHGNIVRGIQTDYERQHNMRDPQ